MESRGSLSTEVHGMLGVGGSFQVGSQHCSPAPGPSVSGHNSLHPPEDSLSHSPSKLVLFCLFVVFFFRGEGKLWTVEGMVVFCQQAFSFKSLSPHPHPPVLGTGQK